MIFYTSKEPKPDPDLPRVRYAVDMTSFVGNLNDYTVSMAGHVELLDRVGNVGTEFVFSRPNSGCFIGESECMYVVFEDGGISISTRETLDAYVHHIGQALHSQEA